MEEEFDRASACERRLQELLHLDGDDSIQRGLLTTLVDCCEQPADPKKPGTFEISLGRWVLRTDDLNVFTATCSAITALANVKFEYSDLTTAGIAALATGVIHLCWNIYRATGHVTTRQAVIITILRNAGTPLTVEAIYQQPNPGGDMEWTREQIEKELKGLQQVITSGAVRKMAECLSDGRWVLNGV